MPRVAKVWWRESHGAYYAKINGKQTRLSTDYKEANQLFHRLRGQAPQTVSTDSVYGVLDEFLEWTKVNRPKSFKWYKSLLRWFTKYFRASHPNMRIDQLKPIDVQRWLDASTYEPGTKAGIVTALKRAFNWATKEVELISRNPLAGLKKPEPGRREEFVSAADFKAILTHVTDQPFRDLLTFIWQTGCRPHEAINLEASHVRGNLITYEKEAAKGKRKQRLIFLSPDALKIVARLAKAYPIGRLFRNEDSEPWTNFATNNRFSRLEEKLGRKFCMYQLRHGFAHKALTTAELSPEVTAKLMGHSDTSMIYRVYGHLAANHDFMSDAAARAATGAVAVVSSDVRKSRKKKPR